MLFSTATLTFLRGLKRHNDRVWFEAHRAEYEAVVKRPMRELIEEMDVRMARFAPEVVGDAKRSMFRIYRDIRFSPDKSPYKTHASCWFFHRDGSRAVGREAGGEGAGAGFYVQIAAGDSFVGGGRWMPPRDALLKLREAIADDPKRFTKIVTDRRRVLLHQLQHDFHRLLELRIVPLAHRRRVEIDVVVRRDPVVLHLPFPVQPIQREARGHDVAAVDQLRIAADPDQSAPRLLPH